MKSKLYLTGIILLLAGLAFTGCEPEENDPGPEPEIMEPNDSMENAKTVVLGDSLQLTIKDQDEDWFSLTIPSGQFAIVSIDFDNSTGDLDMIIYNSDGELMSSRNHNKEYPYYLRVYETGNETHSLFSTELSRQYYILVKGFANATNDYSLTIREAVYSDCCICEDEGYSLEYCYGFGENGEGLLPFPLPVSNDPVPVNNYLHETFMNYRYARPEVIMLVRYAIKETSLAFPGTMPLGLGDMSQSDGLTPAQDVGIYRHPLLTHDQGGNIDIAYFQTGEDNSMRIICGDAGDNGEYCNEGAAETHIVDLKKTAFFMAKLYDSPRLRVIGADRVIGPLILESAQELADLSEDDPKHISDAELSKFHTHLTWGDGWPYHHHHIHVSFHWW
jgi:hypothetical protein